MKWHRRFRRSLRGRLVVLFLLLAFGTTLLFVGGTRTALGQGFELLVRPLLADYVDRLAAEIGSPPDVARAQALVARLPISVRIDGPQVRWASHPDRRFEPRHDGGGSSGSALFVRSTADGHRIAFGLGDLPWHDQRRWRLAFPLLGVILLTAMAYAVVRRLFRPLDDIRAGALRYGGGDFSAPIPVRRRDELGDLATQVNAMATGLQGMLQGQRALLLAISHELRSPLTRARLNAELAPEGAERDALLRDLAEMNTLIADLLESERLAGGAAALKREATELNTLVLETIAARDDGGAIDRHLAEGLPPLALDRARIAMLVRNLVDNACRHGGGPQGVEVATRAEGEAVVLTVRDHGPGVPPEHLERLAQPFYRPDSARTRAAGGVGLGLYLCRLVAQSHGAAFTLRDAAPGLAVEIRFFSER